MGGVKTRLIECNNGTPCDINIITADKVDKMRIELVQKHCFKNMTIAELDRLLPHIIDALLYRYFDGLTAVDKSLVQQLNVPPRGENGCILRERARKYSEKLMLWRYYFGAN